MEALAAAEVLAEVALLADGKIKNENNKTQIFCLGFLFDYNYYQFRNGLNIDFKEKNHYFYENRDS